MRNFSALNLYHRSSIHHHQRYRKKYLRKSILRKQKKILHFPVFQTFLPLSISAFAFVSGNLYQYRLLRVCVDDPRGTHHRPDSLSQLQKPRLTPGPRGFTTFVKYQKVKRENTYYSCFHIINTTR